MGILANDATQDGVAHVTQLVFGVPQAGWGRGDSDAENGGGIFVDSYRGRHVAGAWRHVPYAAALA
jgi:hypothetical protein